MFEQELKETIDAVADINDTILASVCADSVLEEHEHTCHYFCCMNFNGDDIMVDFIGIRIWSFTNDNREYIPVENPKEGEDDEILEPIEDYLRREVAKIVKVIASFPPIEKI